MTEFTNFSTKDNIEIKNKKSLLAVSGGPDPVALSHMLVSFLSSPSKQLVVAYLDHCLKKDSYLENELLQKLIIVFKIKLIEKSWPAASHPQTGIEAKARELRYTFLAHTGKKYRVDHLLTAHHGDDLIENTLLKFIRSGDVAEMNSLQIVGSLDSMRLLRLLIKYSKDQLLEHDKRNGLDYIEDETNFEDDILRNHLRYYVVPLSKRKTNHLVESVYRSSESAVLLSGC